MPPGGPPPSLLPHLGVGGAWQSRRSCGQRWRAVGVLDLPSDPVWPVADGRVRPPARPELLPEGRSSVGVTEVEVNGIKGLRVQGPHHLVYITRDGTSASTSARLTTGNILIWGTRQVALRLKGNLGKTAALAIANSAR